MPINAGSDMPGNTSGLGKDGSASFLMSNFLIFLHVFSGQELLHSGITAVIVALFPERAEASAPLARATAWALEECVKQCLSQNSHCPTFSFNMISIKHSILICCAIFSFF